MKLILSKKIITVLSILVIIAISTKIAFAVWDGNPYSPGATNDPECLPSQTNCDVYPAVITEADPLALRLNQSTPQTFTAGAVTGSGILKVTGGILGLDTNTYLTTYSETDPIFIASSAFGISGTNISNWNTAFGWGNHATAGYLTSLSGALLATGATTGATSQAQQFTLGITSPGTITFSGFTSNGGPLFTNGSGVVAQATAGTSSQVLHGGTSPSFSSVSLASDISGMLGVGNGGTGANSLNDLITLGTHTTGNYVATLTSGSGISSTATGESSTPTISLSALTADWNQTGAFNISLNNSSSGLKILENGATPTLFGIFDVADLTSSDKTYTFPNATGTILTTGNISDITGLADSQISDTLTASIFKGSGTSTDAVDLGTAEVAGTLGVGNGGTGTATAFTTGSVAFAGSSGIYTQDNTNFFFDDTANRFGILDNTPAAALTVGSGDLFQVDSSGAIAAITGYTQGSGTMSLTSANTTQLTTSSAFAGNFNSLTTGTGMYLASSTLSSGKAVDIAVTGTSGLTNQKGINISLSGANSTGAQTTYGIYSSNTHSGTSTNVGIYSTATGGSNNYSAIFDQGNVGIGTTSPTTALTVAGVITPEANGTRDFGTSSLLWATLHTTNIRGSGGAFTIKSTFTGGNTDPVLNVPSAASSTLTSGTMNLINLSQTFAPTSGTGVYSTININPTINQTGGANGITRGLYISPIITAAADWRPFEVTTGNVLFGTTSGNVGIGDTTPLSALTVGNGDLFQVNSSGQIAAVAGYTQGSGTMSLTSANTTQLTTSSAFAGNFNSLTTGTGMYLASSTLSSGKLVDLQVNSTATSSTGQTGLNILLTGANGTASQTTYGLRVSNTHTGTTPINWSAYFDERVNVGAANQDANHALIVRSVDNTANHGLKILAANQTTYMELGYNTISGPGGLVISPGTSTGLSIQGSGVMYVGGAVAPTARVHIAAGTTAASSAPLKFTSGTNMTTAEAGAVEYDGTALTYTNSTPTRIRLLGNNYGIAGGTTLIGGTGTTDTLTLRSTSGTGAAGADIIFQTGTNGGTEAMRILNSGNVGIQQNNPGFALHVGSSSITDGTTLIRLQDTNSTCDFNANAGAPSCGSDATLKKDITSLDTTDLLNKVSALNPVSYRWLTQDRSESPQYGFIAQEVESQFPDLVSPHTWIDGTTKKFLNTGGLMPYTVGAIKELDIKVKGLSSLDTTNNNSTGSLIKRFLADIGNGIEDLYARVIHSDRVETKTLCVGSTCVTEEQFLKMVQQNGAQNNNGNNGAGDVIPPPVLDPAPTPDSMPTPETPPELSPVDIQTPEQTP